MALKTLIPFPIFAPPSPISTTVTTTTTTTEVRFSRWNNANADKFLRQQRTQKQIEDDLRRYRRFESALTIADTADSSTTATGNPNFKSIGTPSAPSSPSIPGKKSKYSKKNSNSRFSHPAFRKLPRKSKLPQHERPAGETNVKIGEDGVVYEVAGAPFEFMYSYTETPKVKPLGLREAPVAPFGPATMPRPWTGRKPLPESKKKVPEFDSFVAPPKKKGVKPVQRPGPFLPGSGPKYVMSREEVLGEPLTEEEVKVLVEGCLKSKRQLNMGRDGLTHNMLDNIHALWKRRRVCKIKCKGVCTVDMDNVCQQLEDKTGGKIIYRKGGVLYLFRGRNYNYKTRPRFPLMLWKPVTPVYPRLIQRVPEGLTLEEATEMRKRGRQLIPICKLAKNGVYVNLVRDVREAFEACELVRINCQGMNGSDYHKIGAKLKDLVPCVLISFEKEHILMWRGRDWKSSLDVPDDDKMNVTNSETDIATSAGSSFSEEYKASTSCSSNILHPETSIETPDLPDSMHNSDVEEPEDGYFPDESEMPGSETTTDGSFSAEEQSNAAALISDSLQDDTRICNNQIKLSLPDEVTHGQMQDLTPNPEHRTLPQLPSPCTEGIRLLLTQAVENGSALVLDDASLVADVVFKRSVDLAKVAPPGPVFRHRPRKVIVKNDERQETVESTAEEKVPSPEKKMKDKRSSKTNKMEFEDEYLGVVVPQGSLKVDELAKLLA